MSSELFIFLLIFLSGFLFLYLLLRNLIQKNSQDPTLTAWLKSLQQSIDSSNRNNSQYLQQNYRELFARLDQANLVMADLKKEAGAFGEVSRSMKELQDYLKSPKLRGNIGEQVLNDLISQMFPKSSYMFQYRFLTGSVVDAAIKTQSGILSIDSKFPMENFQKLYSTKDVEDSKVYRTSFIRDVKKHLKDISNKYILPAEGTLDFALMYLPSESIYYEIIAETELMNLARECRVFPVSPTSLYAHLQTVLLALEGQKIANKTSEIFNLLRSIQKDYEKLTDNFSLMGKHLTNAYNVMNQTSQNLNQVGNRLEMVKTLKISDEKGLE